MALAVAAFVLVACTGSNTETTIDDTSTTNGATTSTTTAATTSTTTQSPVIGGEDPGLVGTGADVRAIAVGPLGLVAVGEDPRRPDINEDDEAAVWVSSDGSVWNRVETDPSFVDGAMTDVVWYEAEGVFVAVGTHVSEGAVWHSADGISWSRVALLTFSGPGGGIELDSIVTLGTGLLAIGREWLDAGSFIGAQWTSDDGTSWERVDLDDEQGEPTQ